MSQPGDIQINVTDHIRSGDAIGGKQPEPTENEKAMKELHELVARYVEPHPKPGRTVTNKDVKRVMEEGDVLLKLCSIPRGLYGHSMGMAHIQIESEDPLRFFVTQKGEYIINPVIHNHTQHTVDSDEGCMSFPELLKVRVQRYNKIDMTYQTLIEKKGGGVKLSKEYEGSFSGIIAKMIQHEIAMLNGKYIYDPDYTAQAALDKPKD